MRRRRWMKSRCCGCGPRAGGGRLPCSHAAPGRESLLPCRCNRRRARRLRCQVWQGSPTAGMPVPCLQAAALLESAADFQVRPACRRAVFAACLRRCCTAHGLPPAAWRPLPAPPLRRSAAIHPILPSHLHLAPAATECLPRGQPGAADRRGHSRLPRQHLAAAALSCGAAKGDCPGARGAEGGVRRAHPLCLWAARGSCSLTLDAVLCRAVPRCAALSRHAFPQQPLQSGAAAHPDGPAGRLPPHPAPTQARRAWRCWWPPLWGRRCA